MGISQVELGQLVGKSHQSIQNYERLETMSRLPAEVARRLQSLAEEYAIDDLVQAFTVIPKSVSIPERKAECPRCKSTLSLHPSGTPGVLKADLVLNPERPGLDQQPMPQSVLDITDLQESEWACVKGLLQVLRSRKPGLAKAIRENIDQFVDADRLWDEHRQHAAEAPAEAGTHEKLGGPGQERAAFDRHGKRFASHGRQFEKRSQELQKLQKTRDERKKPDTGTTGPGSRD